MPSLGKARIINEANGKSYPIKYRETSIGRSKTCDIVLNYPTVSRLHAVIVCAKEGWYIADSSSSTLTVNGLKVNKRADIASGDRIGAGNVTLRFENLKSGSVSSGRKNADRKKTK
ncbi:MAG: FHA domain-containing protein [Clostridia bacterium]|nr:FHA domain-containing protein [Clostridia bacterium]MBR0120679.1 FHA domain-containing protein [Clostridia bacterium]